MTVREPQAALVRVGVDLVETGKVARLAELDAELVAHPPHSGRGPVHGDVRPTVGVEIR